MQLFICRYKVERNRINTVAGVFSREPFAKKDVPQMGTAIGTNDFRSHAIGIRDAFHRSFYFVVEARPATMRIELIGRAV